MGEIQLRQYQSDAVAAVMASWDAGYRAPLIVIPTGGGKTIVFGEIARRILRPDARPGSPQRADLPGAGQDRARHRNPARRRNGGLSRQCGRPDCHRHGARLARGRRIDGEPFELVIIDEAHHALGENQYGAVLDAIAAPRRLGVTATPYRADKKALSDLFDDNPCSLGMLDMIELGRKTDGREGLCDISVRTLPVKVDMSGVHVRQGDFVESEVADALAPMLNPLADLIAAEYADRKLLTFCPLRATSRQWTERLQERGLAAGHVQGD